MQRKPKRSIRPGKLAKASLPAVVSRYLAGESMQILAAENGVARQSLYEWMLGGIGDEAYSQAVTSVLIRRVNEADHALEDASIEPDTARAQARARFARMDLERRRPALYGLKPVAVQVNVEHQTVVSAGEIAGLVAESVARLRHAAPHSEEIIDVDPSDQQEE